MRAGRETALSFFADPGEDGVPRRADEFFGGEGGHRLDERDHPPIALIVRSGWMKSARARPTRSEPCARGLRHMASRQI